MLCERLSSGSNLPKGCNFRLTHDRCLRFTVWVEFGELVFRLEAVDGSPVRRTNLIPSRLRVCADKS